MKRHLIILAAATALLAPAANAATYSVSTNAAQEAAIGAARAAFNGALPACSAPTSDCSKDTNYQATNGAYLLMVITSAVTSWQPLVDKGNKVALLTACVNTGGLGGLTTAQCQALLTQAQAGQ